MVILMAITMRVVVIKNDRDDDENDDGINDENSGVNNDDNIDENNVSAGFSDSDFIQLTLEVFF